MRIGSLSNKATQIEGQIQTYGPHGPQKPMMVAGGHSIIQLIELDDYVRVMIEVGEEETAAGLRRLIPLVLRWRDETVKIQGPWTRGGRGLFFVLLDQDQRKVVAKDGSVRQSGLSYQQLAERLNRQLKALLSEYLAWERRSRTLHRGTEKRPADATDFWPNPFSKIHAVQLLTDLGITEQTATQHVEDALARLRDGRKPFVGMGPITRQRVIDVLRAWRRRHDTPAYRERHKLPPLATRRRG